LENFGWPYTGTRQYLRNGSSDPLRVWFRVGVGGSSDAISGVGPNRIGSHIGEKMREDYRPN